MPYFATATGTDACVVPHVMVRAFPVTAIVNCSTGLATVRTVIGTRARSCTVGGQCDERQAERNWHARGMSRADGGKRRERKGLTAAGKDARAADSLCGRVAALWCTRGFSTASGLDVTYRRTVTLELS